VIRCLIVCGGLLALTLLPLWGQPAAPGKDEALHTRAGKVYHGLILDELPTEVRFQVVQRKPGRPVVLFSTSIPAANVKRLDRLAGKDRDALLARLHALDPIRGVELKVAAFAGSDHKERLLIAAAARSPLGVAVFVAASRLEGQQYKEGWSYESDHFLLVSTASDEIVRRVAVRLEQMYALYAHYLPPVGRPAVPNTTTSIRLLDSMADYQDLLRNQGRDIFNLAYFDAARNEIVCAADLGPLARQLADLRRHQEALQDRLRQQEAELKMLPKGEVQDRARMQLQEARQEIAQARARNAELFHHATRQLFRSVYHEGFHAYLANFVFPPSRGEVPRWLNEGLAQVFEEAVVEGNDLRVGPAPAPRLDRLQALVKNAERVELGELLRSGSAPFVVAHGQDRQAADRHYLLAWALARYLMFERRLLGTPALDEYLVALNGKFDPKSGTRERGADPVEALVKLVGQPLRDLEKELHEYIMGKMAKLP
jgi:hypothetical protein